MHPRALEMSQSREEENLDKEMEEESKELEKEAAREYRALAARLNYLAMDRPDIQYPTKEM